MKNKLCDMENKAENVLRACLEKVPFVRIALLSREVDGGGLRADLVITIALPDSKQTLVVDVKNNGQPRLAREAVNQLMRYRETYPDSYGVFIAPYISPRSAEICTKDGIGYVDLAGNCRLSFNQVYIEQEGKPNPFAMKRDLRSLYSPKAARVLRVLLSNSKKAWKTQELTNEAKVSLGQISNVKKLLGNREWISATKDGFLLSEPGKLLTEWSENYTYRKSKIQEFYTLKELVEIERDLSALCKQKGIQYALTGFSGATRLAPAVRYQRAMAYVGNQMEEVASLLNLKEVTSGANVLLLTPYDEGVFYGIRQIDSICIASPVQIYLDLKSYRGRGEEAAKALFEEVIRPTW